jgi:nucleotide-binding universal stress UspA family protein
MQKAAPVIVYQKRKDMKKILVPTDFSVTAERAYRYAADIASKSGGSIFLYHALLSSSNMFIEAGEIRRRETLIAEKNTLKRLERLKKKISLKYPDLAVSALIGRPPVTKSLLEFASDNGVDLIVMGTQGASGLKKALVGSVASKIVSASVVPVLLVPEKFKWEDPKNIIFTTGMDASDKKALRLVEQFAELYHSTITVLHLLSAYSSVTEKEKEQSEFDSYAYMLKRKFSGAKLQFRTLRTDSVIRAMESLYKEIPYDLMVMVRRKKTFLERFFLKSFTQNMAYVTKYPLLVVPAE